MTDKNEYYKFFEQWIQSLNDSLNILETLKKEKIHPVLFNASFRFSLIEYAKPFKHSRGLTEKPDGKKNTQCLDDRFVPIKHKELHKRITDSRDQFHAHSDMAILNPQLYVTSDEDGKSTFITKNIISGTEEYKNLSNIIELINSSLDQMDNELIQLRCGL